MAWSACGAPSARSGSNYYGGVSRRTLPNRPTGHDSGTATPRAGPASSTTSPGCISTSTETSLWVRLPPRSPGVCWGQRRSTSSTTPCSSGRQATGSARRSTRTSRTGRSRGSTRALSGCRWCRLHGRVPLSWSGARTCGRSGSGRRTSAPSPVMTGTRSPTPKGIGRDRYPTSRPTGMPTRSCRGPWSRGMRWSSMHGWSTEGPATWRRTATCRSSTRSGWVTTCGWPSSPRAWTPTTAG